MLSSDRRRFIGMVGAGVAGAAIDAASPQMTHAMPRQAPAGTASQHASFLNVRSFGAAGDGHAIDSTAVNAAIEAAEKSGGGTVFFPAGNYLCYSIRLRSNISLYLDQGAVLIAAEPPAAGQAGGYDLAEPRQPWEEYQDSGHNHWHDSLIWGENLHDISILGPGRIWGRGLSKGYGPGPVSGQPGVGNKAISLKLCHNVLLKDFQILQGGWFGILATGVDNLTIDGLTIDTNRDGMDIDCCRNVRVSNCSVNSPWDDAIVPKSSFALGYNRATENVSITNCYVTAAYELGSMLDGTWKRLDPAAKVFRTGRIKFGTESNGGFKNIVVSNCVFEGCQGLALESEDGALLEDMSITNITMRDINSAPIFLRLGSRLRGPKGTQVGALRRVLISNIVCSNAASQFGCIISGIPGHPIEDVTISNIYLQHRGGGTKAQAALNPPEKEAAYPDPEMFGDMPSQGFYIRHAKNIDISNVRIVAASLDERPAFVLQDVDGAEFFRIRSTEAASVPKFALKDVRNFSVLQTKGVKDTTFESATQETL
ncbi:MAG TPA: glycoside hydrolase family 28 protein [Acidisarcina sp.]|nr:glycoside hydrolase family 28 protein [Acidisarcina sp.]